MPVFEHDLCNSSSVNSLVKINLLWIRMTPAGELITVCYFAK